MTYCILEDGRCYGEVDQAWETAVVKRAVKKGLTKKVTFGERLKGDE